MSEKRYCILNYGCQMNESDAEHFAGQLSELGYRTTGDYHLADVVVVNTCCVRESAEKKILGKIGELKAIKAAKPEQVICISGCMAQKDGTALLKKYPQIDFLVGTAQVNNFKPIFLDYLAKNKKQVYADMGVTQDEFEGATVRESRYAAWIPIMYGCNNFCTYCIVPHVRGRERSRTKESILREIELAVSNGYKEFTLLGQNVNSYGHDVGEKEAFAELLLAAEGIKGVERLRYMSSHPRDMSEAVIRAVAGSKHICPHFHIAVQSGSNRILQAMNRGYTRERFLELAGQIRHYCPEASLTTDIIVGFPGESEEEFQDTVDLIETVRFDAAYTFLYSTRSGTPAAGFAEQVAQDIKKERLQRLMNVQNVISLAKNRELVGLVVEVMAEGPSENNPAVWRGRTGTNKLVLWETEAGTADCRPGELLRVKVTSAQTWLLKGTAV